METFELFAPLGFFHILDTNAWDHLLFLLLLVCVYGFSQWKQWGMATLLFSLGHTLSLCAGLLGWIFLPNQAVEIGILLTLVVTALVNLHPKSLRPKGHGRSAVAGFFGLVHGLGFAKDFKGMMMESTIDWGAVGSFTLGLEGGQLAVVLVVLSFLTLLESGLRWRPREIVLFFSGGGLFLSAYILMIHFYLRS